MRIDSTLRHSVAFLTQENNSSKVVPMASAFFVAVNLNDVYLAAYVVTARHNLEFARKDRLLYLRLNTFSRKFTDFKIHIDDFIQHWSSDIAVASIQLPPGVHSSFVPYGMILRSEMTEKVSVREGASVCMLG